MIITYDKARAIAEADRVLREQGITAAPVPVDKIAKALGATVHYTALDDVLSGMAYVKDGQPIIGVNSSHHSNRQRFTIAHEIGHLVLHRDYISQQVHVDKSFKLRRDPIAATGTDAYEIEANAFAAQLLMPEEWVKAEALESELDDEKALANLARKFQVSTAALQNRLMNLF